MADNTADGAAQRVLALIDGYGIDGEFPYKGEDIRDHIADLRALLDEREQLRERAASATVLHDRWTALLAERNDARSRLRAETATAKELLQRNVELGTRLDNAEAKREDAEAALERLRGQLGETRQEWGIWWPGSNLTEPVRDEATARGWAAEYKRLVAGGAPELVPVIKVRDALVREAGPWREDSGACLCPHDLMPDGRLVRDGVVAIGCPVHDPEEGGNRG